MTPEPDSIDALTRDPAAAELMRRALRQRAEEYAGTPLGEKFADVLAGRLDVRALGDDPTFAELADRTRVAFDDYWAGLDADQREAAVRAGNARLAEVAEEMDSYGVDGAGPLTVPFWVKALLLTVGGTALWLGGAGLGLAGAALLVTLWPRLPTHDPVRE